MPPKRNHGRKNSKPPTPGATAGCILPQHVMLCILTRLPVRSIYRFKAVCKPWLSVLSNPKFRKMHHAQFSENPENQSVVIYSLTARNDRTMSLFKIESGENSKPINLDLPFPRIVNGFDFVGSCNGLLCLAFRPIGQIVILWNPALNMSKPLPLPGLEVGAPEMVSLGLGYDDEADDFKVVRIVGLEKNEKKGMKMSVGVEVYSANSNSWRRVDVGFQFSVYEPRNETIVNGNPYWVANVDGDWVLVCFDVAKMAFKIVPLPRLAFVRGEHVEVPVVNWKGDLGALVCNKKNGERVLSLDVWVFDDVGKMWSKNFSFRPTELKVDRVLQCLRNGMILGECLEDGKMFVWDAEGGGGVKEIVVDGGLKWSMQIYGYTESLACVKGMRNPVMNNTSEVEKKKIDNVVDRLLRSYIWGV